MKFSNIQSNVVWVLLATATSGRIHPQINRRDAATLIARDDKIQKYAQLIGRDNYEIQIPADSTRSPLNIRAIDNFIAPPQSTTKPSPKQNPTPPPKSNNSKPNPPPKPSPPPQKTNHPPQKPNPPPKPQPPNNACNARLNRRQCLPFWPFSGRNSRDRRPARPDQYERPMPDHPAGNDMIQVAETQVGFLIKGSKLGWFTPMNTAAELTSVGNIKAIGAIDVEFCSMVALVNQHGAIMVHLSRDSCLALQKGTGSGQSALVVQAVNKEYKPLKQDAQLFFNVFKKEAGSKFIVVIGAGPKSGGKENGEFMAKQLFGIDSRDISHVVYLEGNANNRATFIADFSGSHPKILHGPTGHHPLTEEPGLVFP